MKFIIEKGVKFWEGELSFGLFLLLILITNFVILPLSAEYSLGGAVSAVFWFFMIITGSFVVIKDRKYSYIITGFVVVTFLLYVYGYNKEIYWLEICEKTAQVLLVCIILYLILVKVFEGGIVNPQRIIGSIAGYLLLGNLFYSVYLLIYAVHGQNAFNMPEGTTQTQLLYYSYVTLTSTGYGDILPLAAIARTISNIESIVGQLYPAILIARLISLDTGNKTNINN